ncbi:MAG: hypothetical protein KGJ35_00890 [Patescibacteria group bacterium]|nr:hypothetical protein [Patescibacteria group bacterium]
MKENELKELSVNGQEYQVYEVDYSKPLSQMIKDAHLNFCDINIDRRHFKTLSGGRVTKEFRFMVYPKSVYLDQAIQGISEFKSVGLPWTAAAIDDLLIYLANNLNKKLPRAIIVAGSKVEICEDVNGLMERVLVVPCFESFRSKRLLRLSIVRGVWVAGTCFLAVRPIKK